VIRRARTLQPEAFELMTAAQVHLGAEHPRGVTGTGGEAGGRYTLAQRDRLLREGVRWFFSRGNLPIETMGDCRAFSYVSKRAVVRPIR
jgi:hypothetical protein